MKNKKKRHALFGMALFVLFFVSLQTIHAQQLPFIVGGSGDSSREDLERKIQDRAKELEEVSKQISATQEGIKNVQTQQVTLQRELKKIDTTVSQLKLNIQADAIKTQKLALEIQSLDMDLGDIETSLDDKTEVIGHTMRKLQRQSEDNAFVAFLKYDRIADSVLAVQTLSNLNTQLIADMNDLRTLRERLNAKGKEIQQKHSETLLHKENLENRKLIVQDQESEKKFILSQTKSKESTYQKQLADLEKQQNAISDEIAKIEAELKSRFDVSLLPTKRPGALLWPLQLLKEGGKGILTQHFGERSNLYRGKPHNGLDIGAPIGTPVFAAEDGTVSAVDNNDRSQWSKYQYGKYVLIDHASNFTTLYAHLSRQTVQKGQQVKRGDVIGYSGNTGYATGPHLHFGLYWKPTVVLKTVYPAAGLVPIGVIINPEDYL